MSLSDADYHAKAHALLARIEAQVDAWLEEDVVDIDSHRTGGLLELSMPGGSKIVINTQPPLQEIWLAARSGGYHFKWDGAQWVDREGQEFCARLSRSASEQAGQALKFSAC
ncbi:MULTISPECIES: iron donor protein CyaY [Roseateles]|uniref:Iron-sulfur cluster assembly protein CyaY n=1 Tax=Pelomonas aquatica TaxID=431058 RepID=A0ABU1ZBL2_9BURK|nr:MULTISPECIES: iron donor protein CyaY [Roseateles]KQY89047.1 iron donor protein CyaY [Pelomonas sp. Root1444]MDR7298007.1 CyaY protein [Pelomonas aquatica]